MLFNHGEEDYEVQRGERVAQLIVERVEMCEVEEVEVSEGVERSFFTLLYRWFGAMSERSGAEAEA